MTVDLTKEIVGLSDIGCKKMFRSCLNMRLTKYQEK